MDGLTIGEVARRRGLATSALRFWERAGILPPPLRHHQAAPVRCGRGPVIAVLRFAQGAGFTLDEIRTLLHGIGAETPLGARWEALAHGKLRELDALIDRATRMRPRHRGRPGVRVRGRGRLHGPDAADAADVDSAGAAGEAALRRAGGIR